MLRHLPLSRGGPQGRCALPEPCTARNARALPAACPAALMMGVGGGTTNLATLRLAGVAGMVGGALSMAVSPLGGGALGAV